MKKKQFTPIDMWNTVCDANVDLFRARAEFSAEMFDLYTKWPRKSFSDITEAMKTAHLETLKVLAEKSDEVVAKAALKKAAKPAAKPPVKAKPVAKKKAKPAVKAKPVAKKKTKPAAVKPVTAKPVAAEPVVAPPATAKAVPEPKVEAKPVVAPVVKPTAPTSAAPDPVAVKPAPKPAAKSGAKTVTLPDVPDFSAKPRVESPTAVVQPETDPKKDN